MNESWGATAPETPEPLDLALLSRGFDNEVSALLSGAHTEESDGEDEKADRIHFQ